jgi:hypothetical protein
VLGFAALLILRSVGILSVHFPEMFLLLVSSFSMTGNGQVLPTVGNFIFVRPELLPGFLIKLNIKN